MDTLREEYKCLETQLTESKRVEFADKFFTGDPARRVLGTEVEAIKLNKEWIDG